MRPKLNFRKSNVIKDLFLKEGFSTVKEQLVQTILKWQLNTVLIMRNHEIQKTFSINQRWLLQELWTDFRFFWKMGIFTRKCSHKSVFGNETVFISSHVLQKKEEY